MADNVLKGTIKIDAPGVKETFTQVEQGVSNLQKTLGAIPATAKQSSDGLVNAFAKVTNIDIPPVKIDAEVETINIPKVGITPIEIPVTANTDAAKASFDNLGNSIKPLAIKLDASEAQVQAKLLEGTIETLEARLGAKREFIRVVDPKEVTKLATLNKEIQDLEKEIARLKNIGKTGFDELGNKVDAYGNHLNTLSKRTAVATQSTINLGRVIQDAPYGFIGIANNLNPLLEGFQRLKAETGSVGGAFNAFGSSLLGAGGLGLAVSVVSSLLVVFGERLFSSGNAAKSQADKLKEAKQALDDYQSSLDGINKATLLGKQSALEQLAQLKTLYAATQNTNISLADRKKLVDELQEQYPKYFANISDEIILAGGAKKAYDQLSASILASAKARAAQDVLVDIQKQALTVNQEISENAANQIKLQQQLNTLKAKGTTSISATGEERLTAAGAQANKIQQQLNSTISTGNDLLKQRNDLNIKADQLARLSQSIVEQNPNALLKPTAKPKATKEQKTEFLFDFLPFDPSGKLKPEQKAELLNAVDKFSKEFGGVLQGALFTGDANKRIEQAKEFDLKLKAGNVKFDLRGIKEQFDKIKPEDLIPLDFSQALEKLDESRKIAISQFVRGFQDDFENQNNKNKLDISSAIIDTPEKALADLKFKLSLINQKLPSLFDGITTQGLKKQFTLDDLLNLKDIQPGEAIKAIENAYGKVKSEIERIQDDLNKTINDFAASISTEGFSSIGEAIGAALLGNDIGNVFQQFESFLGGAVESLGKKIIALNVAALAVKKSLTLTFANPALGIAAGIGLVAVGAALKSLASGGINGSHYSGLKRVPKDGYIAELHKDEMVVPAKQSEKLRSIMGADFSIPSLDKVSKSIGVNINAPLPSFKGIQIPNIQLSQLRSPSIPSTNYARFNSNIMGTGSRSLEITVKGESEYRGDHILAVFNRESRKQKISF